MTLNVVSRIEETRVFGNKAAEEIALSSDVPPDIRENAFCRRHELSRLDGGCYRLLRARRERPRHSRTA
jgi:hypothetical protein